MPKSRLYILKDQNCAQAINEHKSNLLFKVFWLEKYRELYRAMSYGKIGFARIADANYDGELYKHILGFVKLY